MKRASIVVVIAILVAACGGTPASQNPDQSQAAGQSQAQGASQAPSTAGGGGWVVAAERHSPRLPPRSPTGAP